MSNFNNDIFGQIFADISGGFKKQPSNVTKMPNFGRFRFPKKILWILLPIVLIILCGVGVSVYVNILELNEIGDYAQIYIKPLLTKLALGGIGFAFSAVFALVNLIVAAKIARRTLVSDTAAHNKIPKILLVAMTLIAGIFGAASVSALAGDYLTYSNSVSFGQTDPIFGNDIGYYLFQRSFLVSLVTAFRALLVLSFLLTVALYLISLGQSAGSRFVELLKKIVNKSTAVHLFFYGLLYFGSMFFTYRFKREGLLNNSFLKSNSIRGIGYVDANVWVTFYKIAPYLVVAVLLLAAFFLFRSKFKMVVISLAVYPAAVVVTTLAGLIVSSFIVSPNEPTLEKEYIRYNMEATRDAFGLSSISGYDFSDTQELTTSVIDQNSGTIDNIRVIDYIPTLNSDQQLQRNTNFYKFVDGDIIPLNINGEQKPVFITAREIETSNLPDQSDINRFFRYTHGYGIVINPINSVSNQGQVDFILSGLRMDSTDSRLSIKQPRIYYGENTKDYAIVNPENSGKLQEIDYDGYSQTNYSGNGGVKLSLLNRLIYAVKYSDINFLISSNVDGQSKLLLNRQVVDRAQKAAPFLQISDDPYIVPTDDGRLVWVLDGFTVSNLYPYSQTYNGVNYIRNSVKVTVDAYDGTVKFYRIDDSDPIVNVVDKIYPGFFTKEVLPDYVKESMRYPEELFKTQTTVLARYHLDPNDSNEDNANVFYGNQDKWEIAKIPNQNNVETAMSPYYNMIKLPNGDSNGEEFILMQSFTPSGGDRHNMVSWLAVKNDPDHYGQMILFKFPRNTNILGPDQVEVNINQSSEISQLMTLWGQSGSEVFKGSMLVIPIENSVLYVEPIYIQSSNQSSIPQIRKIVVGFQKGNDFIYGIGDNLKQAIDDLFGTTSPQPSQPPQSEQPSPDAQALQNLKDQYNSLKNQLDELGKLIDQLMK